MQRQPIPRKPLLQGRQDPFGVVERLECHHQVIGEPGGCPGVC
jgi:hypothetical protein